MLNTVQSWANMLTGLSLAAATTFTQAALVSNTPAGIDAKVITFSPYDSAPTSVSSAVDIGTAEVGEVVTLVGESNSVVSSASRNFLSNGSWPTSGAYASLNSDSGSMVFQFSRGVNFVGGLLNYLPGSDTSTTISALDINGDVIFDIGFESVSLEFTTGAEFRGFFIPTADIYGLSLSGNFISLDNLTFGTTAAVPEPQSLLLVLLALGALGWRHRNNRMSN